MEAEPIALAPAAAPATAPSASPARGEIQPAAVAAEVAAPVVGDALERAEAKLAEANASADELLRAAKAEKMRKRHRARRVAVSSRNPVPIGGIKRLARRGGVKRISQSTYDACRETLGDFLRKVLKDAALYTQCAKRSTVYVSDVLIALERAQSIKLYGYGNAE